MCHIHLVTAPIPDRADTALASSALGTEHWRRNSHGSTRRAPTNVRFLISATPDPYGRFFLFLGICDLQHSFLTLSEKDVALVSAGQTPLHGLTSHAPDFHGTRNPLHSFTLRVLSPTTPLSDYKHARASRILEKTWNKAMNIFTTI